MVSEVDNKFGKDLVLNWRQTTHFQGAYVHHAITSTKESCSQVHAPALLSMTHEKRFDQLPKLLKHSNCLIFELYQLLH